MTALQYADFDLAVIEHDGEFVAHVLDSPSGQADGRFEMPFSPDALENFILKMGHTRTARRGVGSARFEIAQSFGDKLYRTVFAGEIGDVLSPQPRRGDSLWERAAGPNPHR